MARLVLSHRRYYCLTSNARTDPSQVSICPLLMHQYCGQCHVLSYSRHYKMEPFKLTMWHRTPSWLVTLMIHILRSFTHCMPLFVAGLSDYSTMHLRGGSSNSEFSAPLRYGSIFGMTYLHTFEWMEVTPLYAPDLTAILFNHVVRRRLPFYYPQHSFDYHC